MHAEPARQARPIMKMSQRLMLVVLFTGLASACSPSPDAARVAGQFVDESGCADCHAAQHKAWTGSHHDLAMQGANEQTVLADFNNSRFTYAGVTSRFFRRDGSP